MSLSTGNSRALMGVGRPSPFPAPPKPPAIEDSSGKAPMEDLSSKDKRLALEMAEAVGANTPIVRLMEDLELELTYDALPALMK